MRFWTVFNLFDYIVSISNSAWHPRANVTMDGVVLNYRTQAEIIDILGHPDSSHWYSDGGPSTYVMVYRLTNFTVEVVWCCCTLSNDGVLGDMGGDRIIFHAN